MPESIFKTPCILHPMETAAIVSSMTNDLELLKRLPGTVICQGGLLWKAARKMSYIN